MAASRIAVTDFPFALNRIILMLCAVQASLAARHVIAKRTIFSEPVKDFPGPEKNYTGIRIRDDSTILCYHHEQTVAVIELSNNELLNCELLEVRTKPDKIATLSSLKRSVPTQVKINFSDMNDLMQRCQSLEHPKLLEEELMKKKVRQANTPEPRAFISVFKGVFPGTKWCGAGDLAANYYDIGPQVELDKCCRTHDLCPVKVAGLKTQYNLTNYSPTTRSHCDCDDIFYRCLKKVGNNLSDLLGNIYFNLARPVCVEDVFENDRNRVLRRQFATRSKSY